MHLQKHVSSPTCQYKLASESDLNFPMSQGLKLQTIIMCIFLPTPWMVLNLLISWVKSVISEQWCFLVRIIFWFCFANTEKTQSSICTVAQKYLWSTIISLWWGWQSNSISVLFYHLHDPGSSLAPTPLKQVWVVSSLSLFLTVSFLLLS